MKFLSDSARFGIFLCALACALFACACAKKTAHPVSTVKSDLLLEIFQLIDEKNYEAALPKIERYQVIDETNVHISALKNQVRCNAIVRKTRILTDEGRYAEALAAVEDGVAKFGELDPLVAARTDLRAVAQLDSFVQELKQPCSSSEMAEVSLKLERFCEAKPEYRIFTQYAKQKQTDAKILALLERDRSLYMIYLDAKDALAQGKKEDAAVLTALLSLESGPLARDLMHSGLFFFHSSRNPEGYGEGNLR